MYDKMNNIEMQSISEEILFGNYKRYGQVSRSCMYMVCVSFFCSQCLFSLKTVLRGIISVLKDLPN